MNFARKLFSISIFLINFLLAYSQDSEKIAELYFEGNEYIMSEEYIEALPVFLELLQMKECMNFNYKVGECYLHLPNQKYKAIPYLEKAIQKARSEYNPADPTETNAPLKAILYLGRAYRINNDIEKAIEMFSSLADSVTNHDASIRNEVNREIEICENARLFIESPVTFDSVNLDNAVNNHFSNYHAVISEKGDKMYFMNALKFYDAIMEAVNKNGKWSRADNITMKLKSDGDFYVTDISSDGTKLLFYFYNILSMGDLYESNLIDGEWSPITKLRGEVNTDFNETHATISNDGKTLYFASNRPGGLGGLDIYSCTLNDSSEWEHPVNLGNIINTSKNEDTPFITTNGNWLFFASEGHFTMGEFDVFKSEKQTDGQWGKPMNLGYPVNNTDVNTFYYPHQNGNTLYVSDFSPKGEGQKDILRYWNISEPRLKKFRIEAGIISTASEQPIVQDVSLEVYHGGTLLEQVHLNDHTWENRLRSGNYTIIASADDYVSDTVSFFLDNYQDQLHIPVQFTLKPKEKEKESITKTIQIKNIYFAFDSYRLSEKDKSFLNQLYEDLQNTDISITVHGHSDSKGPSTYNLRLSELRAKAVFDYLILLGFETEKITMKAMGEKQAIARNTDANGNDIPEGRKYNRRVELLLQNLPTEIQVKKSTNIPRDLLIQE